VEKQRHNRLIRCVRQLVATAEPRTETDQELLQRFVSQHDEAAFAAIIRRHGPMVLRVALRTLQNEPDSEDVFQATFLVLSQKAHTLRRPASLGSWLYGIAYRLALKTKATAGQRRNRERSVAATPVATPLAQITLAEAQTILDEELSRLPERFRQPVVLCCLEGLARDEAAQQIGCPASVLKSRLEQGRERLSQRLIARGLTLPCGLGAFFLLEVAAATTLPPALIDSTTKAATLVAAGKTAATGLVSAKVATLTEGVLKAMLLNKLKTVTTVLFVALGMVVFGGGLYLHQAEAQQGPADKSPAAGQTDEKKGEAPRERAQGPNKIMVLRASHLTLLDPDGKNARKVGEDKLYMLGARLSSDGKKVAALFQTPQKELVPPPPPGEQSREVKLFVCGLEKKEPWTDLGVKCRFFAWSPDGTEIACSDCTDELYPQFNDGPNVKSPEATHFVVNVATKQKTALKLSKDHVITDWSRDGKLFLTTSVDGRAGEKVARMHLMNRDGTEHKALTDGKQPAMFGRLSPDGKRVLYCTPLTAPEPETNKRYKLGLDVLDIASGKVDRVQESGDIYSYCWSPDAKRIAYAWREWHEGEFIDLLDKEHKCYLVVCDQDGKNRKTIATETGRSPATIAIGLEDWRQGDKPLIASDKPPTAEERVKVSPKQEQNQEKEGFTAWGKEVGGLQAGLGYPPGQKRAYSHGETVRLVVRVRNVGKEEVKFSYLQPFIEHPLTVTDGDGKSVPQLGINDEIGERLPGELKLAPGKEIELHELKGELRPASEALLPRGPYTTKQSDRFSTLYGTGKISVQYERVLGDPSRGRPGWKLDPALSKLATGKLELEIKSPPPAVTGVTPPPKQEKERDMDLAGLEGKWDLISEEHDGKKRDLIFKSYQFTFKGKEVTTAWVHDVGADFTGDDSKSSGGGTNQFIIDSTKNPKELTITGDNIKIQAVYKLDKDQLTIALFGKPEEARPKGFTAADAAGEGRILVVQVLKRAQQPSPPTKVPMDDDAKKESLAKAARQANAGKDSKNAQPVWGKPLNGLRLGLYQTDPKGDGKPRLTVVLDNVSTEDLVLNLGSSYGKGKKHWLNAVRVNLTDTDGRKRVLLGEFPKLDDLRDGPLQSPFVIQLVAGGRYVISRDLTDFYDPKDVDAVLPAGRYRATAEFVGRALIKSKTDKGPPTFLDSMTYWTGTVQSDNIQATLPAKPAK
jgi:RNA polymerase sigma factor (sigma-70 family)